jgi:hypothetical protein
MRSSSALFFASITALTARTFACSGVLSVR